MPEPAPLVSVLLPIHNGFPYLPAAVESILAQSEPRWILYALNDGSTDETAAYLDSVHDARVVPLHWPNQGLSKTLNDGLLLCSTPYIARMDADDVCHPDRFARQIAYLDSHPNVGMLGSQIRRLGAVRADAGSALPMDHDAIMQALLDGQHGICHPTVMCRREAFQQVGEYKSCVGEDWDMYLRFGERWQLANHPDPLLDYRFHASSINGARMREMRRQIRFHCECARRRMAGQQEPSRDAFMQQERGQSWVSRWLVDLEDRARARYNSAVADQLGRHPWRGRWKLLSAAIIAPHLTWMRVRRQLGVAGR